MIPVYHKDRRTEKHWRCCKFNHEYAFPVEKWILTNTTKNKMKYLLKNPGHYGSMGMNWVSRHKTVCGMDAAAERTRTYSPRVLWRLTLFMLPRLIEKLQNEEITE